MLGLYIQNFARPRRRSSKIFGGTARLCPVAEYRRNQVLQNHPLHPAMALTFFCGIAASNIALTDYIRAKAMFRPSGRRLETPPGNAAL